ncbi:TetR/AcrR family transcriptional regulator [Bacillus sp. HMF5848]|uniref:TetR/AcrR family transcriptional regulator n=1 Tax=Bacillus sp. HMF5848 TaxID=2495421 RepID=UPI000F79F195|nr:TetR/AcrR family transcriptional regulator [Bacillus sp. HMF5848]RSK26262.1 TetR/AcrR family transcriptional regulator [Bacillus sp. HMF5848]
MSDSKPLKERILDAALQLFERYGYHGVTVNQIVAECSASKGGFYHNFSSKDELLYEIHDYFISYVLEKAKRAFEECATPTEKLVAVIQSFVKVFHMYKAHITVFYQESMYLRPEYKEAIATKRDEFRTIMRAVIVEGVQSGEFREELNIDITVMSILGTVNWTYKWYQPNGASTIEEIAELYIDLILHSILTNDAKVNKQYAHFFRKIPCI